MATVEHRAIYSGPVRRALDRLDRQIKQLEVNGGNGGGGITAEDAVDAVAMALTEGTGIDIVYNDAANTITLSATGGGGTGTDEVWIGTSPPTDPNIELWYDPEAAGSASATAIIAIPYDEWPPANPQPDVLYLRIAP